MKRMGCGLCQRPADHRTNWRDCRTLGNKHHLAFGRAVEREGAKRPGEIQQVANLALEHPCGAWSIWNQVKTQLERLAVFRTGRDGIWAHTRVVWQRKRNRDKHAGRIAGQLGRYGAQEQRACIRTVIEDSLDPRLVSWPFHQSAEKEEEAGASSLFAILSYLVALSRHGLRSPG